MATVFEAVIDGKAWDTIDPIYEVTVSINNGAHTYTYGPEDFRTIEIRPLNQDTTNDQ